MKNRLSSRSCSKKLYTFLKTVANKYRNILYVLPLIIVLAIFIIIPVMSIFYRSMFTKKLDGSLVYVGLNNYISLIKKDYFAQIIVNTVIWIVATVVLKNFIGLLLALLLNKEFKGKKAFELLSLLPWATPWIISSILFKWIYDGLYGYLNSILYSLSIIQKPIDWLGNESFALWGVIFTNVWTAIPFCGFVYLSVLYSIPNYLYEAAEIDGATKFQSFMHITLPQLIPTMQLVVLLTAIWGLNSFDMIYTMTDGGPIYASETLVTHIYRLGFRLHNSGQANALSVITFLIMIIMAVIYIQKGRSSEEYA